MQLYVLLVENGPLQFTGASYIYWQMAKPLEHRIEVAFAVNTRQLAGPLVSFKWSALRSFKIRLLNDGHIAVSPVDFMSGSADSDWLVSKGQRVSDGQWHRVRFALFASATDEYESSSLGGFTCRAKKADPSHWDFRNILLFLI